MSLLRGAPYVGTNSKLIEPILSKVKLKPGMKFLELGCGDGRVVCEAVQKYGAIGRGVDVSSLWLWFARMRARKMGIESKVTFFHQNVWKTDLAWADVIYVYLMPRMLTRYQNHLKQNARAGTQIISHSFELERLSDNLTEIATRGNSRIYYYRVGGKEKGL